MEEKKLTDEEIVKDIERSTGMPSYWKKIVLDLIHRLQQMIAEQKAEIERLNAKYRNLEINYNAVWEDYRKYEVENAELHKQVDELKELNAKYLDSIESVQAGRCRFRCELTQQAVKDTAKEIFEKLLGYIGSQQQFCIVDEEHKTLIDCDKLFEFVGSLAKEKGVEV